MNLRRSSALIVFMLGSAINPAAVVGCAQDDDAEPVVHYEFGEPELEAMVDSLNETRAFAFASDGKRFVVELELTRSSTAQSPAPVASRSGLFARRAGACGTQTRTFFQTASACVTLYETALPVEARLKLLEQQGDTLVESSSWEGAGSLRVVGLDLATHWGIALSLAGESRALVLREDTPGAGFAVASFDAADLGVSGLSR